MFQYIFIVSMRISMLTFMLLQVGAYAFACQRGSWPFHYKAVCLLPLMDMLNHRRDGESNAIVDQNKNGSYSCYAKRDIKAGEEVGSPSICKGVKYASHNQPNVTEVAATRQAQHFQLLLWIQFR